MIRSFSRSIFVALLFTSSIALAQKPGSIRAELPELARRSWDNGQELLRARDYKGAASEFRRAYDLSKNPRVLYNVAVSEKELQHYVRAAASFEQELREGEGKLTREEKTDIETALAIVKKFIGSVDVTANEPDATLYIDDYAVEGKTPFTKPVPIDVGPHTLTLKKEGFKDQATSVTIAINQPAKASFRLEPAFKKGIVQVTVIGAPRASVFMDGKDMGPSPFKGEVSAERHTFEARAPGFVSVRQTVEVPFRDTLNLQLNLSEERHEGRVRIEASPAGATIEIDGKVVGSSYWEGVLPTGGHQLIVKKTGFDTFSQEIALQDDQVRSVRATLTETKSNSWVWWTVGAVAVVGGTAAVSYFVFKPSDQQPVVGTLDPGIVPGSFRR